MANSSVVDTLGGMFVLGVFNGVSDEQYPKLSVRTFLRSDGTWFDERLDFAPFDARTGERTLPEGLTEGVRVAVSVKLDAKAYVNKRTGEPALMVSKKALSVVVL